MKINELTIGCLVMHQNEIYTVRNILEDSVYATCQNKDANMPISELNGVQLTNDTLKKLGLIWHKKAWRVGYFKVTPLVFSTHFYDCFGLNIQYVHQLQNLASLHGVELNKKAFM